MLIHQVLRCLRRIRPQARQMVAKWAMLKKYIAGPVQTALGMLGFRLVRNRPAPDFSDPVPWYTRSAIRWIEQQGITGARVLEFGGGASTLWWCARTARVHTVEASAEWASALLMEIHRQPQLLKRWRLSFVPCEWQLTVDSPKPYWKRNRAQLTDDDVRDLESDYATAGPDDIDIVVVDGAARFGCLDRAARMASQGRPQFVVVDNTNNQKISDYAGRVFSEGYRRLDFAAGPDDDTSWNPSGEWTTSIWLRS